MSLLGFKEILEMLEVSLFDNSQRPTNTCVNISEKSISGKDSRESFSKTDFSKKTQARVSRKWTFRKRLKRGFFENGLFEKDSSEGFSNMDFSKKTQGRVFIL